ncbi:uncharacterized protein B0P05DRAFT_562920 [Gilbertella persicaria]|uniref:uncharacterized protein n=1 Tax=Gilbertella persicaria TaxID=101096 RepID=UPI002220413F|nr:uncharacterized protein B0P05DRAFT_562920 [Gilbertella persicaria]KAI8051089.1 hypothetical protein B0P05DRAFT_562920 [Gilbertella persicaria]
MEDDDLVMDVEEMEEDEDMTRQREESKGFHDDFMTASTSRMSNTPIYRQQGEFARLDASPVHSWGEVGDEKSESVALLMHMEKTIVHQKFFQSK